MTAGKQSRIVVLGGGFAGLAAALELPANAGVSLVDARPSFEFLPNIHELVSGVKKPEVLQLPLAPILRRAGHRFVRDRVVAIDRKRRVVELERGSALAYEVLIVALGGVNATRGVPGVSEHALPFKSVEDCDRIGRRLARLSEEAGPRDVVVVGSGLEGVEALGEILRAYGRRGCFRLHVIEARDRLLPEGPADLDRFVRDLSQSARVDFRTGARVARVEPEAVVLEDGERIPSDATIWTGGPTAPALLVEAGLAERAGAWAPVEPTLQSAVAPEIFVAGDCAELASPIAKQAYHALDMGRVAARNALRLLEGERLDAYEPSEKPALVSFGDRSCFLIAGRTAVAAPALALGKEAVFELVMAQLDRRGPWGTASGVVDRVREAGAALFRASFVSPEAVLRGTRIGRGA